MMKRLTPLMFGLAMAFGMSGAAMAQGSYGSPDQGGAQGAQQGGGAPAQGGMPGGAQETPDFSDEDLQAFADVQPKIESIRSEYADRLQQAENPEEAAELQNEAGQMMVDAVNDAGLEVETYNNIAIALQSDAELREKVESMM